MNNIVNYEQKLRELSTSKWSSGLLASKNEILREANLIVILWEKIKGLFDFIYPRASTINLSDSVLVKYQALRFIQLGYKNNFINNDVLIKIIALAKKAYLISEDSKNKSFESLISNIAKHTFGTDENICDLNQLIEKYYLNNSKKIERFSPKEVFQDEDKKVDDDDLKEESNIQNEQPISPPEQPKAPQEQPQNPPERPTSSSDQPISVKRHQIEFVKLKNHKNNYDWKKIALGVAVGAGIIFTGISFYAAYTYFYDSNNIQYHDFEETMDQYYYKKKMMEAMSLLCDVTGRNHCKTIADGKELCLKDFLKNSWKGRIEIDKNSMDQMMRSIGCAPQVIADNCREISLGGIAARREDNTFFRNTQVVHPSSEDVNVILSTYNFTKEQFYFFWQKFLDKKSNLWFKFQVDCTEN